MGVIHQHWRQICCIHTVQDHPLHAAGHTTETVDGLQQHRQGKLLLKHPPYRLQQVHQVEATQQGRAETALTHRADQAPLDPSGRHLQVTHVQLGRWILKGAAPTGVTESFGQARPPGVIAVDHRSHAVGKQQRIRKQRRLGLEVVLHRGVVVEVVLREVGEHGARETAARHPLLRQGVGTHLHRRQTATGGGSLGELPLQEVGKGRGVGGRDAVARPAVHQRAE